MIRRPPRSPLFPYTPLFRSNRRTPPQSRRPRHSRRTARIAAAGSRANRDVSCACSVGGQGVARRDRKSTRLNSSHSQISYAVFCLKKKKKKKDKQLVRR